MVHDEPADGAASNGPLTGIRVVEVASWIAGPAAGQLLRDLGAEVTKVESPGGDGLRGVSNPARTPGINPPFEITNRGKTIVTLDLRIEADQQRLHALLDDADVLITNLSRNALTATGFWYDTLRERHPGLVYCLVSGYGSEGPDRHRPGFDGAAYWAASGFGALMTAPGQVPPTPRAAMGDHATAVAAAGGICAALFGRSRTGLGAFLDISLRNTAAYALSWDFGNIDWVGQAPPPPDRETATNPLNNYYRLGDGRWIALVNVNSDAAWPGLCRALDLEHLVDDPKFADRRARATNAAALVAIFDRAFASEALEPLAPRLDAERQIWASFVQPEELLAAGNLEGVLWEAVPVAGETRRVPRSPFGFRARDAGAQPPGREGAN